MSTEVKNLLVPRPAVPLEVSFLERPGGDGRSLVLMSRFTPEPLGPGELSPLAAGQKAYECRRAGYVFDYLRVFVDGEETASFSPGDMACEQFGVPTTSSFVEVTGEDDEGELLLAVFPLTQLDPFKRIVNERSSAPCGNGQQITLIVTSPPDFAVEHEHWILRLECSAAGATASEDSHVLAVSVGEHVYLEETTETFPTTAVLSLPRPGVNPLLKISVIGIGSSGSNTVDKMIAAGVRDVTFAAVNTDLQALQQARAPIKVQLAQKLTRGLGTGGDVAIGRAAALESTEKLTEVLRGADMVFITTGLGGGTGTGATPVVANLARELGALTVCAVTTPFFFEGTRRAKQAVEGLKLLSECVDTVITTPNERLLQTVLRSTSLRHAFDAADGIMRQAVQSILELVTVPGLINLDFADVRTIMEGAGKAFFGTGRSSGELRALEALEQAIASPLCEEATIQGARSVLVNVTGGTDLRLQEVNEVTSVIREAAEDDADIIFGAVIDEELDDELRVTVIATGFGGELYAGSHDALAPLNLPRRQRRSEELGEVVPEVIRKLG